MTEARGCRACCWASAPSACWRRSSRSRSAKGAPRRSSISGGEETQQLIAGIPQDGAVPRPERRGGDDHRLQRPPVLELRRLRARHGRPADRAVRAHAARRGSSSATSRSARPRRRRPPTPRRRRASRTASGSTSTCSSATRTRLPRAPSPTSSSRTSATRSRTSTSMPGSRPATRAEVADRVEADAMLAAELRLRVERPVGRRQRARAAREVLQDSPSTGGRSTPPCRPIGG